MLAASRQGMLHLLGGSAMQWLGVGDERNPLLLIFLLALICKC
jgi:hypothetical protein